MKIIVLFILAILGNVQISHCQIRDTLEQKMSKQYRLKIYSISKNGNWVMVGKHYDLNRDTVLVLPTKNKKLGRLELIGPYVYKAFLKEEAVITLSNYTATLYNLTNDLKKTFKNVKRIDVLDSLGVYALLDQNNKLTIYNSEGNIINSLDSVQIIATDRISKIFVLRKGWKTYEIFNLSDNLQKRVYSSPNLVKRIEISDSKNLLSIVEENGLELKEQLVLFNIGSGKTSRPILAELEKGDYISVQEIDEKGTYFVSAQLKIPRSKETEIWYGNDGNLISHQLGFDTIDKYWIVRNNKKPLLLPNESCQKIFLSGNANYLFAFKNGKLQNYVSRNPNLDISLLDIRTLLYKKIDTVKDAQISISKNGDFFIYKTSGERWVLYNVVTEKKRNIPNNALGNPVFNEKGSLIYFESNYGLSVYDLKKDKLRTINNSESGGKRILNKRLNSVLGSWFSVYRPLLDNDQTILVETKNKEENKTSYFSINNNKIKYIISSTNDFIREFYYTDDASNFIYTKENYSKPANLNFFDISDGQTTALYQAGKYDNSIKKLKNEIISYRNSDNKLLKGVLYYPLDFDLSKKYPVVVRIYQIQNDRANNYEILGYNNDSAFDLRALVESGYFVYLPDIVYGNTGTGLSALDCVNKALDAIESRPYLDKTKMGLTGHSHGGYETNFIATQSSRFATYVSGAGNSDIVRSYFSYNYNFSSPFYWQYENGQYEMKTPFNDNKELYLKNSPINYCENVSVPILLWSGKKDENIAWDQVMEFYIGLKRNEKNVIALFYPSQGHNPVFGSNERKDLYYRVLQWWDYFLKDKKDVPWINKQMIKAQ